MLPFTELMSIGGSAHVNTSIFVMEASYRNVSCPGKAVTAVINSGRAVIADRGGREPGSTVHETIGFLLDELMPEEPHGPITSMPS